MGLAGMYMHIHLASLRAVLSKRKQDGLLKEVYILYQHCLAYKSLYVRTGCENGLLHITPPNFYSFFLFTDISISRQLAHFLTVLFSFPSVI